MEEKWLSLVKMWTIVAVLLSQTVTADQLSDETVSAGGDVTVDDVPGSCWLKVEPAGRCSGLYALNVTRAECCALRPGSRFISYATGWTPTLDLTSRQYFYWIIVGQGVPGCQPCRYCLTLPYGVSNNYSLSQDTSDGRSRVARQRRSLTSSQTALSNTWQGPVCAFDGRTHRNLCALAKSNCRSGRNLPVEYTGPCQSSCENVTCPSGKHCAHDRNGVPHCIHCRTDCPSPSPTDLVCGGDGQTYASPCVLQLHACFITGRPIRIAYRGRCRPNLRCSQLRCGASERCLLNVVSRTPVCFPCSRPCVNTSRRAVCASDGRTYESRCHLERAACRRGVFIDAIHSGRCAAGETTADIAELNRK